VRRICSFVVVLTLTGCSSAKVVLPRGPNQLVVGQLPRPTRPRNVVYRDEFESAIAEGLQFFLQKVPNRALMHYDENGKRCFDGYLIERLRPANDWMAFDFAPGDIVTHINGTSLGQQPDAILAFVAELAKGAAMDVALVRDGQAMTVHISVVDRPVSPAVLGK